MVMTNGLSANQLKTIAILAMTLDHLAWTLFPGYSTEWFVILFHIIGRITAPVMWFFVAEGYYHTRNIHNYMKRMFLLAFLSHFTYNFCFGISLLPFQNSIFNQTGVVWSLAWGLVLLHIFDNPALLPWQKLLTIPPICLITFPSDWSCVASMAVLFVGLEKGNFRKQMQWIVIWTSIYALVYYFCIDKTYAFVQLGTCLSIPLLKQYNGEKGRWKPMGKVFYIYYPLHLAACGILRILL